MMRRAAAQYTLKHTDRAGHPANAAREADMSAEPPFRVILETPATSDLLSAYRANELDVLARRIDALIGWQGVPYRILELPSFAFTFTFGPGKEARPIPPDLVDTVPDRLVFGLAFDDLSDARA